MRRSASLTAVLQCLLFALLAFTCISAHAQTCYGTCQVQPSCTGGTGTTVTGIVYAPNGTDPIPNVLVYIPSVQPDPLPSGVQCLQAGQTPSGAPVTSTTTAVDGTFTLGGVPVGSNIPIVIQSGKWRLQSTIPSVTACANTVAPASTTTFPTTHLQGDLPRIAIATGNVDAVECVLHKIGIADSEFTDPTGSGVVNLFKGDAATNDGGATISASTPSESVLESSLTTLNSYDVVMFPCQGTPGTQANSNAQQNLLSYTAAGGRVFATHYSYVWLNNNSVFSGTANWQSDVSISTTSPMQATINSNFSEASELTSWLNNVNALYSLTPAEVSLYETRKDISSVISPTQTWLTLNDTAQGNPVMQMTFTTPVGALPANQCGRVLFNDYHVENSNGSNGQIYPNECVPAITAFSVTGNVVTFYAANSLNAGNSVTVSGLTTIEGQSFNGQQFTVLSAGLSSTSFEVAFAAANTFGKVTDHGQVIAAMTPQEKLLEYSLFDLSSFVQPQPLSQTITFAPLPSPVPYGTAPLTLVVTGGGSGNPITFTVTGPGVVSNGQLVLTGAGTVTITANQAGNSNYTAAAPVTQTVIVTPIAPTVYASSNPSPVFISNIVTFTATVASPVSTPTGSVTFYSGTTPIVTTTLVGGVATAGIGNLSVGNYAITAVYSGDNNFLQGNVPNFTQTVLDFSLTPVGITNTSVLHGGTATFNFILTPIGGNITPANITFTVTGARGLSVITLTPSSLPAASGTTQVSLSITPPTYPTTSRNASPANSAAPFALLALVVLPFARRMRRISRRLQHWIVVLILFAGAVTAIGTLGCGSGWPSQTRGILVTATSGNLTHTTEFVLTEN